jgi:hypothetical protein
MPVGHIEWDQVTNEFNSKVLEKRAWDKMGLQRKFNFMKDAKISTDNPNPPKEIAKAKELNEELLTKLESNGQVNGDAGAYGEFYLPTGYR